MTSDYENPHGTFPVGGNVAAAWIEWPVQIHRGVGFKNRAGGYPITKPSQQGYIKRRTTKARKCRKEEMR